MLGVSLKVVVMSSSITNNEETDKAVLEKREQRREKHKQKRLQKQQPQQRSKQKVSNQQQGPQQEQEVKQQQQLQEKLTQKHQPEEGRKKIQHTQQQKQPNQVQVQQQESVQQQLHAEQVQPEQLQEQQEEVQLKIRDQRQQNLQRLRHLQQMHKEQQMQLLRMDNIRHCQSKLQETVSTDAQAVRLLKRKNQEVVELQSEFVQQLWQEIELLQSNDTEVGKLQPDKYQQDIMQLKQQVQQQELELIKMQENQRQHITQHMENMKQHQLEFQEQLKVKHDINLQLSQKQMQEVQGHEQLQQSKEHKISPDIKSMSSKSKVVLTPTGVRMLFDVGLVRSNKNINLQVVYLVVAEKFCYLRLCDGKFFTPLVAILKKKFYPPFDVGAVLAVKSATYERDYQRKLAVDIEFLLKDKVYPLLVISSYTILEERRQGGGDSLSSISIPYKETIDYVLDLIEDFNHNYPINNASYIKGNIEANELRKKGNHQFGMELYEEALIYYDMAKANDPYDYRLWSNASQAHIFLQEYPEAQNEAMVAIKLNPFHGKAYNRAGLAALQQGHFEEATRIRMAGEYLCGSSSVQQLKVEMEKYSLEKGKNELTEVQDNIVRNIKNKKGPLSSGKAFSFNHLDNEENVDPNARNSFAPTPESSIKEGHENKKDKVNKKKANVLHYPNEVEETSSKKKSVLENRREEEETSTKRNSVVENRREEDWKSSRETPLEVSTKPRNLFQETLKDGRRFYETNNFKQALEMFAKVLSFACPAGDRTAKNGYSGCVELLEIQFIIGVCKIQASFNDILDGMDMMRYFSLNTKVLVAPAAAHYFLGVAFAKCCLNKMAQSEASECRALIKVAKHKSFKWPGSDDVFPESDPERLRHLSDALHKKNKNLYSEQDSLSAWKILTALDPMLMKKVEVMTNFTDKYNYMEVIIKTSIEKDKRQSLGMFASGDNSGVFSSSMGVHQGMELIGRALSIKPQSKAKCRFKNCITTQGIQWAREEIYESDPDFKGYVDVICEEVCTIPYHPCCWKAHKEEMEEQFGKMSDKDFLGTQCVTPDCTGKINAIKIYDETGILKHNLDANKKDHKNASTPVKQKKKKDKKKASAPKSQADNRDKKKSKNESVSEDCVPLEETVTPPVINKHETSKGTESTQNAEKEKAPVPVSNLPIDPESLDKVTVVIKPAIEEEMIIPTKTSKKKKKNKKPKELLQPDFLGDPLEVDTTSNTSEYVGRLRMLKQQREAQEVGGQNLPTVAGSSQSDSNHVNISQWLDPENPFYLPQHLRDNPEELERVLQTKRIAYSSPNIEKQTITTLLEFVYEWLKSEGPMSINDERLRQYVADNFPQEALDHVNQCGGIKQFLMQSIDFAMIDEIICVRDHVVQAQEFTKKSVSDRMMTSRFLISDGRKARKFTHLLDDTKSSCSSSSSTAPLLNSSEVSSSFNSRTQSESSVLADLSKFNDSQTRVPVVDTCKLDSDLNKQKSKMVDNEAMRRATLPTLVGSQLGNTSTNSTGGLSGLDTFEIPSPSQSARFQSPYSNDADVKTTVTELGNGWNLVSGRGKDDKKKSASVGLDTSVQYQSEEEDKIEEFHSIQGEFDGEESEEDEDGYFIEQQARVVESQRDEIDELKRGMKMLTEQNQKLNDKLIQVKSSTNIDISSLKRKVEELCADKRDLEGEKQALSGARESEARKFKTEMSRMQEEVRSFQSRHSSLEHKFERTKDRLNEIEAKLVEEQEVCGQLREEVKNLQESLTCSSRRGHEAEVKYLCMKKDLSEAHLNRTIDRLTVEAQRLRQLLQHSSEHSIPDRATISRSIVAWDESIKSLKERKAAFMEEGKRMLAMVNQGRPLNALPAGDLEIPVIPDINIAPLLVIVPNAKKIPLPAAALELSQEPNLRMPPPPINLLSSPTPVSLLMHPSRPSEPQITPITLNTPPGFEAQRMISKSEDGVVAQANFNSGAVPKGSSPNSTSSPYTVTASDGTATLKYSDAHKLFIGKIPWEFSETDVKKLFSDLFGEVVGVTMYDKGFGPDGKAIPKYGFVTFRSADDREKALMSGPIMVGNHTLNIQAKEPKKQTRPLGHIEPLVNKSGPSAYGLSDFSLNATPERSRSVVRTLSTPPVSQTNAVTKPKFQNLTSTNAVSAIGTLPPKLVRPQPRQTTNSKGGSQANAAAVAKEETTAYKRLVEVCKQRIGKEYSVLDISNALREVRTKKNNSLSGLSIDMIVDLVKQQLRVRRPGVGQATVAPWAGLTQGPVAKSEGPDWQGPTSGEIPLEDQCSICLEALNTSQTVQLQCQHVFHEKCIGGWLKRQSNCPNCRTFALMADEYPTLKH